LLVASGAEREPFHAAMHVAGGVGDAGAFRHELAATVPALLGPVIGGDVFGAAAFWVGDGGEREVGGVVASAHDTGLDDAGGGAGLVLVGDCSGLEGLAGALFERDRA